jgi:hypothetical protein
VKHKVRTEEGRRTLLCAGCGATAAIFESGMSYVGLMYFAGLDVNPQRLPAEAEKELFALIDRQDIAAVDEALPRHAPMNTTLRQGIDAYCPTCDALYCKDHSRCREERDSDNYYDGTTAVCPKGHQRVIDD